MIDTDSVVEDHELDSSWHRVTDDVFRRWANLVKRRNGDMDDLVAQIRRRIGDDVADQFEEWLE